MSVTRYSRGADFEVLLVCIANLLLGRAWGYIEYLICSYQAVERGLGTSCEAYSNQAVRLEVIH